MEILLETILWITNNLLHLYFILVVVNVVLYWGMHFNLIAQGGDAFKKFLKFLHKITEPVYAKLREHIKPINGFDVSPYALIIALYIIMHILSQVCSKLS